MVRTALLMLATLLLLSSAGAASGGSMVNVMTIDGPIDPATAQYVHRAIDISADDGVQALIIRMDTPGGLADSMDDIAKDLLANRLPVVVYVTPRGARAASAGAIITLAGNVAAMSPGTRIGASHPVGLGGDQPDKTMSKKMENDAAASARTIAAQRKRNVAVAEQFVRTSISLTEREARQKNVIDIIAADTVDLLRQIDGRKVLTAAGIKTLATRGAQTRTIPPSLRERFLHVIGNPNIAYIFMLIAIYGIIFELSNPGSIFPGVVGGISLLLALYSFAVIPINLTGALLIVFAVILFIIDLFTPSSGVLTAGGIISFLVGSLILFETGMPFFRVSLTLVITMTVLTAAFFMFAAGAGMRAQKNRVVTGAEGMIGETARAITDIDPQGKVLAEGEYWNAVADGESIRKGETVRIVGIRKLTLTVRKEI